jgi:hypothetical protein
VTHNPWKDLHTDAETEYQGGNRRLAVAAVNTEYLGTPGPRPCPADGCGGTLHWRATVGSMMCPDCRRSESSNGVKVYNAGGKKG